MSETLMEDGKPVDAGGSAESGSKSEEDGENSSSTDALDLPPVCSAASGRVNLWARRDSNGDVYLELDMPGIRRMQFFFNDFLKPHVNHAVEQWRSERESEEGGGR